jgi:hypothetical protein
VDKLETRDDVGEQKEREWIRKTRVIAIAMKLDDILFKKADEVCVR